jgi:hypothetical protein
MYCQRHSKTCEKMQLKKSKLIKTMNKNQYKIVKSSKKNIGKMPFQFQFLDCVVQFAREILIILPA